MTGKLGGARPNSGRPRKSEQNKGLIVKAEKQIGDKLPILLEHMLELAQGVMVEKYDWKKGERRVYKEAPDYKALEYLINRVMGKPTDKKEIAVASRSVSIVEITLPGGVQMQTIDAQPSQKMMPVDGEVMDGVIVVD
jgi:hypothetical protein